MSSPEETEEREIARLGWGFYGSLVAMVLIGLAALLVTWWQLSVVCLFFIFMTIAWGIVGRRDDMPAGPVVDGDLTEDDYFHLIK